MMSILGSPTSGQPYMSSVMAPVPKNPAKTALPNRNAFIILPLLYSIQLKKEENSSRKEAARRDERTGVGIL